MNINSFYLLYLHCQTNKKIKLCQEEIVPDQWDKVLLPEEV